MALVAGQILLFCAGNIAGVLAPEWRDIVASTQFENSNVDIPIYCDVSHSVTVKPGQTVINFDPSLSNTLSKLFINDIEVVHTQSMGYVTLPSAVDYARSAKLIFSVTPDFTLISSSIDGVVLSQNRLLGTIGRIDAPKDGKFLLRATYRGQIRDTTLTIPVLPTSTAPTLDINSLPESFLDAAISTVPYRDLGNVGVGSAFSLKFGVTDIDSINTVPTISYPTGFTAGTAKFPGVLPNGLVVHANPCRIDGRIANGTPAGQYIFNITVANYTFLALITVNFINAQGKRTSIIDWITPSGNIGTLTEFENSTLSVRAKPRIDPL